MKKFTDLSKDIQDQFIDFVLRLEPERLFQDGERNQTQAQAEANRIFNEWADLEKKHNVTVSQEEAEQAAWRA